MKQLVFDTTVLDTDRDNVGAFVRSSDGTLIDHATINSVERLAVDSTLKDGAGNALSSTSGALDVNLASGSITVNEEDIFTHGDAFTAGTDKGSFILATKQTTLAPTAGVADGDFAELKVNNNGALYVDAQVSDAALANVSLAHGATSVDNTAGGTALVASALASRKYLHLANEGNKKAFIGVSGSVTTANGFPLSPGEKAMFRAGDAISPAAITSSGTADMRYLELS